MQENEEKIPSSTSTLPKNDEDVLVKGMFKINYIPSVNTQYMISHNSKVLDPEVRENRNKVWYQLRCCGYDPNCIPQDCYLTIELGFYMINSINRRDLDNCLKNTIDILAKYFNFNDNRVTELACYKRQVIHSDKELIFFRIKKSSIKNTDLKTIDIQQKHE